MNINLDEVAYWAKDGVSQITDALYQSFDLELNVAVSYEEDTTSLFKNMLKEFYLWDAPLSVQQKNNIVQLLAEDLEKNSIWDEQSFSKCASGKDVKKIVIDKVTERFSNTINTHVSDVFPVPASFPQETDIGYYVKVLEFIQKDKIPFDVQQVIGTPSPQARALKYASDLISDPDNVQKIKQYREQRSPYVIKSTKNKGFT